MPQEVEIGTNNSSYFLCPKKARQVRTDYQGTKCRSEHFVFQHTGRISSTVLTHSLNPHPKLANEELAGQAFLSD